MKKKKKNELEKDILSEVPLHFSFGEEYQVRISAFGKHDSGIALRSILQVGAQDVRCLANTIRDIRSSRRRPNLSRPLYFFCHSATVSIRGESSLNVAHLTSRSVPSSY